MKLLGITVPPEAVEKFKKESQFKKGQVSFNKGKKQSEFLSKAAIAKSKKTRFKKGQLPPNTKYNGCISTRNHKGIIYKVVRVDNAKWEMLHVYTWKQAGKKIPKGSVVVFKDGDTMNINIANLECITRKQLMLRNTLHNYPKEIALTIQLRGALNRQINKHAKQNNGPAQPHVRGTRKVRQR